MTKFTLANLGKEVQRIQSDIGTMNFKSAIERCINLDEAIHAIEEGEHELVIDNNIRRTVYVALDTQEKPVKYIGKIDLDVAICRTGEDFLKCNELTKSEHLLISHFEDYLLDYLFDKLKGVFKIGGVIHD